MHELAIFNRKAVAPKGDVSNYGAIAFKMFVRRMSEDTVHALVLESGTTELGRSSLPSI